MISKHKITLAFLDVVVLATGFISSFWLVFQSGFYGPVRAYPVYFVPSIVLLIVIFLVVFQLEGLYKYQAISNPVHQVQSLLKCFLQVLAAFILIVFFMKTSYIADSRLTIGLGFAFGFIFMILARVLTVPPVFYYFAKKGIIRKRALIMGAGEHGRQVLVELRQSRENYFEIIGFCDDDPHLAGIEASGLPVLGSSRDISDLKREKGIQEVIIAISNIQRGELVALIERCKEAGLVIHVISDLFSRVTDKLEAEAFGGLITYRIDSYQNGMVRSAIKRMIDFFGASLLLVLFSPLFWFIAWAIKRDSLGPIFYRPEVVGKGENPFFTYKFRSMIAGESGAVGSEAAVSGMAAGGESDAHQKGKQRHLDFMRDFIQGRVKGAFFVENEDRITRVGRILRKYSLDELPQLINVFRGEMSLVGPRFCSVTECGFYKPWHKRRFQVKPGMTGLWQVRARSDVSYDDMVVLDLYYIQNWSLLLDFEILLRTIPVVLFGKGSRVQ